MNPSPNNNTNNSNTLQQSIPPPSTSSSSESQDINESMMYMIQELEEETNSTVDELWITNNNTAAISSAINSTSVDEKDAPDITNEDINDNSVANDNNSNNQKHDGGFETFITNDPVSTKETVEEFHNDNDNQLKQQPLVEVTPTAEESLLMTTSDDSLLLTVEEEEEVSSSTTTPTSNNNTPNKATSSSMLITKATTTTAAAVANTSTAAVVAAATKISSIGGSLAFRYMHRSTEKPTEQVVMNSTTTNSSSSSSNTADTAPSDKANDNSISHHPPTLFSRFRGGGGGGARTSTINTATTFSSNSTTTSTTTTTTITSSSPPTFVFTEKEPDAHKKTYNWEGWSSSPVQKYFGLEVQESFSTLIYQGKKTIDIRRYELPKELLMKPIALLESPAATATTTAASSKLPNVISHPDIEQKYHIQIKGWFTIRQCIHYTSYNDFIQDESKHCVGPDSEYGWLQGYTKELYGWVIDSTTTTQQQQLQIQYMIRRMRSLFEIGGSILPPTFSTINSTTTYTQAIKGKEEEAQKTLQADIDNLGEHAPLVESALSNEDVNSTDEAELLAATTATDPSSPCSSNAIEQVSLPLEASSEVQQSSTTSFLEENTVATIAKQTTQIEPAACTDITQESIPTAESKELEKSSLIGIVEELANIPIVQAPANNDASNMETAMPLLDPSSFYQNVSTSSKDDLLLLLEKANVKIATLEQSNLVLSKKYQEVQDQKHIMGELESSLQKQLEQCGELSHEKRNLLSSLEKAMTENKELMKLNTVLQEEKQTLSADKLRMSNEIAKLKEKVNELETRDLTTIARLNESKKQEAMKSREVVSLQSELASLKPKLAEFTVEKEALDKEKAKYMERTKKAEEELKKELELNEERKKKMKDYVTTKAEELRNAKDTNAALTRELEEMRSQYKLNRDQLQDALASLKLKDTDLRILKTEYERMKADSEILHRMGNSLEGELSKSAREVSEHKQKRLEAKQELMSMLRKLETEQKSCKELKEKIKFTFTPKAISQQKLLNESIESLESALLRLSRRLGKPLPQRTSTVEPTAPTPLEGDNSEGGRPILNGSNAGSKDRRGTNKGVGNNAAASGKSLEWDTSRLLQILEDETQHVSQSIMTLTSSVDRIYMLLDYPTGERSCVSSFADILSGRQPNSNSSVDDHHADAARGIANSRWSRSFR